MLYTYMLHTYMLYTTDCIHAYCIHTYKDMQRHMTTFNACMSTLTHVCLTPADEFKCDTSNKYVNTDTCVCRTLTHVCAVPLHPKS